MPPLNTAPLPVKLRIEDYLLLDRSGAFDDRVAATVAGLVVNGVSA